MYVLKTRLMTFEFDLGHYDLDNEKRDIELSCCAHQQSPKAAEIANSISVC